MLRAGFAGILLLAVLLLYAAASLPDIRSLNTVKKERGVTIENETGEVIATYGDVYGRTLSYDQIPKPLIDAVVATEDRRFFAHGGIDVWGILRAAMVNVWAGRVVQGGSTITQQLAKNVFLTPERSFHRKMQEALLALWLEARYSKEEILSIYLNRVYLGAGTYGVDAASRRYFGKSATQLDLMESAMIAGLLKAPSRFAPTNNFERAKNRGYQVLLNMVDAGKLKKSVADTARANYTPSRTVMNIKGSDVRYFTDWVMETLPDYIGRVDEDLIVTTTIDAAYQRDAQDALQQVIATDGAGKNVSQGAVVSMAPDGAVKALVGGINYGSSQYNRATQAMRQPGSVYKLFVYLAALESGLSPSSMVLDAPITLRMGNSNWTPENYGEKFKGEVTLSLALRESLNTAAVRLSQQAGVSRVARMATRLGMGTVPARPSIALGAVETTLLKLTTAYAHLPAAGYKVEPYGITRIRTLKGTEIYVRDTVSTEQVLASDTVEMMNYMLLDTVRRGTGSKAALTGRDVAGKTGTSQEFKDAWFIGFTPQLTTGVWVGNDTNRPMKKVTGGSLPAKIWHDYMARAMQGLPEETIPNSSTGGGILPWLFGETLAEDATISAPAPTDAMPADVPFGYQNPQPQQDVPNVEYFPPARDGEAVEPAAPKPANPMDAGALLNSIMDEVKKAPVEYEYPE